VRPYYRINETITIVSPEDLRLAANQLRSGWARHNEGIQHVASLLDLMAMACVKTDLKMNPPMTQGGSA
jgi:hypothetical protein